MKYFKTKFIFGWIGVWVLIWLVFGGVLPQHAHVPFTGILSPVIAPITLATGDAMFTEPLFYELYLPGAIFWCVIVGIVVYSKLRRQ